ncbi:MAG: hypothetical protein KDK36_04830 [Leptospiraceae bacterium]|nr:hypothetical protein [Leptospiraceae bacterium]
MTENNNQVSEESNNNTRKVEDLLKESIDKTNQLINIVRKKEIQIRTLTKLVNQIYIDVEKSYPGTTSNQLKNLLKDLNDSFVK